MKRLITLLLISTIGFSQDCENSILDELLLNDEVNQYFQMAISLTMDDLAFINNCDDTTMYTIFAPGINVPTAAVAPLVGGTTPMIDLLLHYIHTQPETPEFTISFGCTMNPCTIDEYFDMLDGNTIYIQGGGEIPNNTIGIINENINVMNPGEPICACNGIIYIIDDLIWPPSINLGENSQSLSIYPNPAKNLLNVSKVEELGTLEIIDVNGKLLLSKEITNNTQIDITNYQKGIYLVNFKSENQSIRERIVIN